MGQAKRDENFVPTLIGVSSTDGTTPIKVYVDPTTHRLKVDLAGGGSGTVTSVSVVSANGFAGTVATATSTPAITLSTTVTGILIGNGTAISAVTIGSGLQLVGSTLSTTGAGTVTSVAATVPTGLTISGSPITTTGTLAIALDTGYVIPTQAALDAKAPLTSPTFATSITGSYLTASELLITDASKNIVSAPVATYPSLTELTYLKGVTSAVQTQLDSKITDGATVSIGTGAANTTIQSDGNFDLKLQTGNATTGSITIVDGANGNINIAPNGAGNIILDDIVVGNGNFGDGTGSFSIVQFSGDGYFLDGNGNETIYLNQVASAVNYLDLYSSATGNGPVISAAGGDTNIDLNLVPKGTGRVKIQGDGLDANSHAIGDSTEVDNGNSGTADTIDWGSGNFQKSTMTGNCTYTFTAPPVKGRFQLMLVQDGTGSRTATWPASVKWPGGTAPTLTTAASSIDIITFYYDGTSYYGVETLNFS